MHRLHEKAKQWFDIRVIIYQSWFLLREIQSLCKSPGGLVPCTCVPSPLHALMPSSFLPAITIIPVGRWGYSLHLSAFNCGPLCQSDQSLDIATIGFFTKVISNVTFQKDIPYVLRVNWLLPLPEQLQGTFPYDFSCAFWLTCSLVSDYLSLS